MAGDPCRWQHTRCRIGNLTLKDPENVVQTNPAGDNAWRLIDSLYQAVVEGKAQSVGIAVVNVDRSVSHGYCLGTGSMFSLNGALDALIKRIERDAWLDRTG